MNWLNWFRGSAVYVNIQLYRNAVVSLLHCTLALVAVLRLKFMSSDITGIQAWVTVTAPVEGINSEKNPALPSKDPSSRKPQNNKKSQRDLKILCQTYCNGEVYFP